MSQEYSHSYNPDGVLGYFITFRCYGTWLHGDDRGAVDRSGRNVRGTSFLPPDPDRKAREYERLTNTPFSLHESARKLVDQTIRSVCEYRTWTLHALNVQDDHVHAVVTASGDPEPAMNCFKTWATRRLREAGLAPREEKVWSRHGSTIWLWTEAHLQSACAYVIDGQPLPPEFGWDSR